MKTANQPNEFTNKSKRVIQKIKKVLHQMSIESIKEDSVAAPTWIRNTILELINKD